ncbi:ATP-binding cassette domain-containing protein [Glutamicibacter sp. MNS18]|uniref:ABC transporter ATP-binding protein n=1 Tax=Glutamicibacter sp. MNS18 TaxID=2989817 RepID=UPI0022359522|nr:ATP-binding cassette domain-containing protein [Glutamicibacter sp. MNS18]MCW4465833.1 ATP-binding cassette domain-containing protein [Glutamicibacter sp. MNS18]
MGEDIGKICIRELSAGYGTQPLCAPLNLDILQGQGLGIIGANGSGKSTVLRTIFDLQVPVAGSVENRGTTLDESSMDYRRDLALLVEDGTFFDELTVAEHLGLTARGHGLAHPRQAVDNELGFFDLLPVADAFPHQLSSGQPRKLMLAACLIRPSAFLVLDEPEQRLDPGFRVRLAERLERLRADGAGLVLVSHDPLLIGRCTREVLLLQDGDWHLLETDRAVAWLGGA